MRIEDVKPGFVLASDVYRPDSSVQLLAQGVTLTESIIRKLKAYGVTSVEIQMKTYNKNNELDVDFVHETLSNETKLKAKVSLESMNFKQMLDSTQDFKGLVSSARDIVTAILNSDEFSYSLKDYKEVNDMFSHSIKVSAFATILAKHYNDTLPSFISDPNTRKKCEINIQSIAVAALLHDIGLICNQEENLKALKAKKDKIFTPARTAIFKGLLDVSYDKFSKSYMPVYSYSLIANSDISTDIKMMILLSGEPEDLTGPLKADSSYITSRQNYVYAAKIIKLCSEYDDTLQEVINKNYSLENVVARLDFKAENKELNLELEKLFTNHVPLYSKGVVVRLSDGRKAIVTESFTGKVNIYRPLVMDIASKELIDLRKEKSLTIKQIVGLTEAELANIQISNMAKEIVEEETHKTR